MGNFLDYIVTSIRPTDTVGQGMIAIAARASVNLYSGVNETASKIDTVGVTVIATKSINIVLGTIQKTVKNNQNVAFSKIKLVKPITLKGKVYHDAWVHADDIDAQVIEQTKSGKIYWVKPTEPNRVRFWKYPRVGNDKEVVSTFVANDLIGTSSGVIQNGFLKIELPVEINGNSVGFIEQTKVTTLKPNGNEKNIQLDEVVVKAKAPKTKEDEAVDNLPTATAKESEDTYYIDRISFALNILFKILIGLVLLIAFLLFRYFSKSTQPKKDGVTTN